jgi:hypothetical protein
MASTKSQNSVAQREASASNATTITRHNKVPSKTRFMAVRLHPLPVVWQSYPSHWARLSVK